MLNWKLPIRHCLRPTGPLAAASIAEFGGRYAVRGGDPKVLEGDGPPPRSVLLEFDSPERAMEWYNSPQYQAALQIRLRSAKTKS